MAGQEPVRHRRTCRHRRTNKFRSFSQRASLLKTERPFCCGPLPGREGVSVFTRTSGMLQGAIEEFDDVDYVLAGFVKFGAGA